MGFVSKTPYLTHVEMHSLNSLKGIPFGKETDRGTHSCFQTQHPFFFFKAHHKGNIKMQGTGCFSAP